VFELQRFAEVKASFDFISEALTAARGDFYSLPGKNHELAVTVATKKINDDYRVSAVFIDGDDVLRAQDDESDAHEDERFYWSSDAATLNKKLSEELVVPSGV
jgi:hypothetical protein